MLNGLGLPFEANGRALYFPGYKTIVRGVFVETSGYKGCFYMRDLYFLPIINRNFVSLKYSPRIKNLALQHSGEMFEGSLSMIVEQAVVSVLSRFKEDAWSESNSLARLETATRDYTPLDAVDPETKLDLGIFALMRGDTAYAAKCFQACKEWLLGYEPSASLSEDGRSVLRSIETTVDLFDVSPEKLKSNVLQTVKDNAEHLGFKARSGA